MAKTPGVPGKYPQLATCNSGCSLRLPGHWSKVLPLAPTVLTGSRGSLKGAREIAEGLGRSWEGKQDWEGFIPPFFFLHKDQVLTPGKNEHVSIRASDCPPQSSLQSGALVVTYKDSFLMGNTEPFSGFFLVSWPLVSLLTNQ